VTEGQPEKYPIDPSFARLQRAASWAGILGTLICLGLGAAAIVLPTDRAKPGANHLAVSISVVIAVLFALGAWYLRRVVSTLHRYDVMADADGLWLAHETKARGIIRWEAIAGLRESAIGQRLDLVDARGRVLIGLEYQLVGFERLRALVVSRIAPATLGADPSGPGSPDRADSAGMSPLPVTFSKSMGYHFLALLLVGVSAWGAWFLGAPAVEQLFRGTPGVEQLGPAVSVLAVIGLIICGVMYYYLTEVSKVVIGVDRLAIHYPLRVREYRYTELEGASLIDIPGGYGSKRPVVRVIVRGRTRPIDLDGLGAGATRLYTVISLAMGRTP
jgi:hypothetical protein